MAMARDDREAGTEHEGRLSNIPGAEDLIGRGTRTAGPIARVIPMSIGIRLLTCSLECPDWIVVGRPTEFRFHVKNRSPTGVVLRMPTSRPWGWLVDDVPEGGTGRFDAPEVESTLVFGPRERRTFVGSWDGQLRDRERGRDVWKPAPGEHDIIAYLAIEDWKHKGLFAGGTTTVRH